MRGSRRVVLRRLLGLPFLALGVATVVFLLVDLAPGDPASVLLRPGMGQEVAQQVRSNFGLDRPLHVRYVKWLGAVARFDLGHSFSHGRPVAEVVASTLPRTLLLSGAALVLAFLGGLVVGVVQAVRRGTLLDGALSVLTLLFYSMPSFWLGLMLILLLSVQASAWGWPVVFPVSGAGSVGAGPMGPGARLADLLWHLALPALTLALVLGGGIARFVRGSMAEALGRDFVRAARARGLSERRVVLRHALGNALLPLLTLAGLYVPMLLGGAVFVETVFAWPGMGRLMVDAVGARDYPVVVGVSLLFAALVLLANLAADVLYAVADPRVRHRGGEGAGRG